MKYCIVITTCENTERAEELAQSILNLKLAACVQLSNITSFYTWQNKSHQSKEVQLTIKTKQELYQKLEKHILDNHKYDTAEILMFPVIAGSAKYLKWIDESVL